MNNAKIISNISLIIAYLLLFHIGPVCAIVNNNISIVPTPKEIDVLNKKIPLDKKIIILHRKNPTKKIKIGVDKINRKYKNLQGYPIESGDVSRLNTLKSQTIIVIGDPNKESWIKSIIGTRVTFKQETRLKNDQSYLIKYIKHDQKDIFLISAKSDMGLLYGCITFLKLMRKDENGHNYITCADIFDKPDYRFRMSGNLKHYYAYCPEKAKELIDFLLLNKINLLWSGFEIGQHKALENNSTWFSEINTYAWDRGIRIVYYARWDLGKAPVPQNGNRHYYPYKGMIGHRGRYYSWNNDDLLIKKCDRLKKIIKKINIKGLYFHTIDTGGEKNPELWSFRDLETKKRFGDDRAAADAHIIKTLYSMTKKVDKNILFSTVVYPYMPYSIQNKKTEKWLIRLSTLIPSDVYLCMREGGYNNVKKWQASISQPVLIYHDQDDRSWETSRPFITSFRLARTFLFPEKDGIYWNSRGVASGGVIGRWQDLGLAEYSWNTKAPGYGKMKNVKTTPNWKQATDQDHLKMRPFIRKATNILLGDDFKNLDLTQFNISPFLMVTIQKWVTEEDIIYQYQKSGELIKKIKDSKSLKTNEFVKTLYLYAISCRIFSKARLMIIDAEERMKKRDFLGGIQMLKKTIGHLDEGEREFATHSNKEKKYKELNYMDLKSRMMMEINLLLQKK